MPIYEYECESCGTIEEAWQKISDIPLTECKRCNGKLHKLISQSSFHLKGSGWYVTDYSNKPSNANTTTKSEKTTSDTTDSKTESVSKTTTSDKTD